MHQSRRWIYEVSTEDLREIDAALAHVRKRKLSIPFRAEEFPLDGFSRRIQAMRAEIEDGTGVMLLRGLEVDRYDLEGAKLVYWGIGVHLGQPLAQNPQAELLVDVRDSGGVDPYKSATTRGYNTARFLPFHNDQGDVVGLLCYRTAKSGGLSCIVSSAAIHNEILATRPDLLEVLYGPYYADVRGEEPPGRKGYYEEPRFALVAGRFYAQHGPTYIRSAQRFPEVPRLTEAQIAAMDLVDKLAADDRFRLDMDFRRGDIQFLNNHLVLHSRTDYEDFEEPEQKRHLLRLWLSAPGYKEVPPFFRARFEDMEYWRRHPTSRAA